MCKWFKQNGTMLLLKLKCPLTKKKCENKTKQSDCVNWFGIFVKIEFRCSHNGKLIVTSQIARANMHFRLANNSIIKTKQNKCLAAMSIWWAQGKNWNVLAVHFQIVKWKSIVMFHARGIYFGFFFMRFAYRCRSGRASTKKSWRVFEWL